MKTCLQFFLSRSVHWTPGVSNKSVESHTSDFNDRSNSSEPKTTTDIRDSSTSCQDIDCDSNQSGTLTQFYIALYICSSVSSSSSAWCVIYSYMGPWCQPITTANKLIP